MEVCLLLRAEGLQGDLKEAAKEAHKILGKGFFESIWDANRSYAEVKLLKEKALTPYQVALLFVALTVLPRPPRF